MDLERGKGGKGGGEGGGEGNSPLTMNQQWRPYKRRRNSKALRAVILLDKV